MTKEEREALQLMGTLRTPGWRVAEELLDAALIQIQDAVFAPSATTDEATVRTLHAQGARMVVEKFKRALHAASSVEAEPNSGGLPDQESNEHTS